MCIYIIMYIYIYKCVYAIYNIYIIIYIVYSVILSSFFQFCDSMCRPYFLPVCKQNDAKPTVDICTNM